MKMSVTNYGLPPARTPGNVRKDAPPSSGDFPRGYDKLKKNDDDVIGGKVFAMAFPGATNFAGPNWSRSVTYRMRPQNDFDLAAKLHDLCYILNDIDVMPVVEQVWKGIKKSKSLSGGLEAGREYRRQMNPFDSSKAAKADQVFRLIVESSPHKTNSITNWGSKKLFIKSGEIPYRADDGFINPLVDPGWRDYLNNPGNILMIPFDSVHFPQDVATGWVRRKLSAAEAYCGDMYINYTPNLGWGTADAMARRRYDTAAPEDTNPGFLKWFEHHFRSTLPKLYALDSDDCKYVAGQ